MRLRSDGTRACDVGGCWSQWPCKAHGSLRMGATPAIDLGDVSLVLRVASDYTCDECGFFVCNCERAPKPILGPWIADPAQEAAELPEGWVLKPHRAAGNMHYEHVTGACAWLLSGGGRNWAWAPDSGEARDSYRATRAEAMAAALGYEIKHPDHAPDSWMYWGASVPRYHVQAIRETAEAAALAALAFDAEQRRAVKP